MSGVERNRFRARFWLRFMRRGGQKLPHDMVRARRSRYVIERSKHVEIYIAEVVR